VLANIDELEREILRWEKQILPLEMNERGKFLSASRQHALDYQLSVDVFRKWRTEPTIASMRERVEAASMKSKTEESLDDYQEELSSIDRQAVMQLEQFRSNRKTIEDRINAARAANTKGVKTLRSAIHEATGEGSY
jgi:hypothetical protein